jgi:DNA-directed RNA polymerase subunit beta'
MVFSPDADADIMLGTASAPRHNYDEELIGGESTADGDVINEDLSSLDDLLASVVSQEAADDEEEDY